jgi:hypothetical protein
MMAGRGRRGLLCLALMLGVGPALAWNAAGHRLVAGIAWNYLDASSRSRVAQLLRQHPDHPRWLSKAGDDEADRVAFTEASTWPDEIRKDARFYSAGIDAPTPGVDGFPDMERHRNWHYLNRPLDPSRSLSPGGEGNAGLLDQQLTALADTLASSTAAPAARAYALPWLIHLVGDAHQPLHTSIRLDAQGKWDRLGNGVTVINAFNPRKKSSTLHAFWDDLPGPPWLRGERLDAASQALAALHLQAPPHPSTPAQWLEESWELARSKAYPPGDEKVATISEAFYTSAKAIADHRVALAGYRLADLLKRSLKTGEARD